MTFADYSHLTEAQATMLLIEKKNSSDLDGYTSLKFYMSGKGWNVDPTDKQFADIVTGKDSVDMCKEQLDKCQFPTLMLRGTLFGDYIESYKDKNETCSAFHFAELLTATSALVGKNIAIDVGYHLYPNFYSVLVGDPGISRKTFSVRRAERLVKASDYTVPIETDIASAEGFMESWADVIGEHDSDGRALLSLSELQRMLIVNQRKGTSNILPFLTDIYDNPPEVSRKKAGKVRIEIEDPFLTMIAGITPGLLEKHFTHDDFSSGFISRLNFYIAEPTGRHPILEKPGEALKPITDRLAKLTTGKRIYTFDTQTEKIYRLWYKKLDHLKEPNELIQQCSVRLEIQVPKLACIFCWMRDGTNINADDWMAAETIGAYWMDVNRMLFSDFAANHKVREQNMVVEALKKLGGSATSTQLSEILKRKMESKRRNEILQAMWVDETIQRDVVDTGGRTKTVYRLLSDGS